ncbi:MAG: nucleotidyl transferase AbiEii/AbiGii toxin family protein [Deltaproteobacteria bacterium]|nr:nucleotidyl transferase AbiEii/AbiGii toxin family protein [Deltaproteobacteria bacterium]
MTGKDFLKSVANGKTDIVQILVDILDETGSGYCLIGGLAVNAYVEPVVSLDIDLVVTVEKLQEVGTVAQSRGLEVRPFEHSLNLSSPLSDLRIQLQTDPRYQVFISRGVSREVLGYKMTVASLEDVLQGKVWAYLDPNRRKSKRQKDLADILRLTEAFPELEKNLPPRLKEELNKE